MRLQSLEMYERQKGQISGEVKNLIERKLMLLKTCENLETPLKT